MKVNDRKDHKRRKREKEKAAAPAGLSTLNKRASRGAKDSTNVDPEVEGIVESAVLHLVDKARGVAYSSERREDGSLHGGKGTINSAEPSTTETAEPKKSGKRKRNGEKRHEARSDAGDADGAKSNDDGDTTKKRSKSKKKRRKAQDGSNGTSNPPGGGVPGVAGDDSSNGFTSSGGDCGGRGNSSGCAGRSSSGGGGTRYPYEVDEDDHAETSGAAYADVAPLLEGVATALGKAKHELAVYDPYFCKGRVVAELEKLGFSNVYNRKEDFYEVIASGRVPPYDVLVTNPPYSGDHIERIVRFCAGSHRPWLLLLPNYVYLKGWYGPLLRGNGAGRPLGSGSGDSGGRGESGASRSMSWCGGGGGRSSGGSGDGRGALSVSYVVPPRRYRYHSPGGVRQNVISGERRTAPFVTFWYVSLGLPGATKAAMAAFHAASASRSEEDRCVVAVTATQIPFKAMDSNDPLRRKQRDRQRRNRK
ncbi:unnamed protein product [Phaeothamnion confervicola]